MRFRDRLLDDRPAANWNGAYPIGNGALGVMVDGGVEHETLYMNDDSFWAGNGNCTHRHNDVFPEIKRLTLEGNIAKTEDLLWREVYGEYAESYLPLCALHIERTNAQHEHYFRELDMSRAVHSMVTECVRENIFASHVDKCIVMRIDCKAEMSHRIYVTSDVRYSVEVRESERGVIMAVSSEAPSHMDPVGHPQAEPVIYDENMPGMYAYSEYSIMTDGETESTGDAVNITGATYIEMRIASTTSHRDEDYKGAVREVIECVEHMPYDTLLDRHVEDYKGLYDRVSLAIGDELDEHITTTKALKKYRKSPDLAVLMFNYARYLMISGSREDSYCMNLQGIWNKEFKPPWSSAYTININIEMNYWIAETTGLSECHMSLMRQLKTLERSGRITAREQFHADGWCCGHNSDIWGHSELAGRISSFNPSMYALYLSGGAWLATHIYLHYLYTGDREFIKEYYYILRGAAEFYLSYAVKDNESDYMVLAPGSSPENTYKKDGERHNISKNATMDSSIARHILDIVVKCADIVGEDAEFVERCKALHDSLYPFKIGSHGELYEWYGNYAETEKMHRHISHLYGLYPGNEINIYDTPELVEAAKQTLKRRGDKGNIGWSLAWKTCMYARLKNSKMANKELLDKLRPYSEKIKDLNYGGCYPNLFSAPPMQVDGNFGIAAGIVEMLMQSYHGIDILPALPKSWANGSFKGLVARGGYVIDATWKNGTVVSIKVEGAGENIDVRVNGETRTIPLGELVEL